MSRWRIVLLGALGAPLVLAAVLTAAWAIATNGDDSVARGVSLGKTDLSGLSGQKLDDAMVQLAEKFADAPISIVGEELTLTAKASDLGLSINVKQAKAAALEVGRHDPGPLAPLRWLKSFFTERKLDVPITADRSATIAAVERLEGPRRAAPLEPRLRMKDGAVTVQAGQAGGGLDLEEVLRKIPETVTNPSHGFKISVGRQKIKPRIDDKAVEALANKANEVTKGKVELKAGDTPTSIDGAKLRPGFAVITDGAEPKLTLDPSLVASVLAEATTQKFNPTGVTFNLLNGVMTPVAGHDATVCCGSEAPAKIVAGLLAGQTTIEVPVKTVTAAEGVADAASLGIKEVVGEFTTKHPAGQPRVKNIHRISDMMRGFLIPPGETLSINDTVGKRTPEKGFVSAPVIDEGQFKEDFGGGVSQFATTLFNASFFAGLDIPEHKAHSIYISRYPFGREATLAFPGVDLKVKNNTPYGVVIWPTYTDNSITVQLWSTKFASGAQTGQNKSSGCGPVTVERTRTFLDGRTDKQTYKANYNCNPPEHH